MTGTPFPTPSFCGVIATSATATRPGTTTRAFSACSTARSGASPGGGSYYQLAVTKSTDLVTWTEPQLFTPRDLNLNYSSPGNVIRYGDQWLLGTQTYPRPVDNPNANQNARIFKMASEDLEHWGEPELLRVKGPHVPVSEMGRMIDAYFFPDKDHPHKWWCGFKQNGMGLAYTYDFETWTYYDKVVAGENVCVLVDREADEYVLIHAPRNGVGIKRSPNLLQWRDLGIWTLGQSKDWPWARGRLSAGHVLDLRAEPGVGKYVVFYHGSTEEGVREQETHGEVQPGAGLERRSPPLVLARQAGGVAPYRLALAVQQYRAGTGDTLGNGVPGISKPSASGLRRCAAPMSEPRPRAILFDLDDTILEYDGSADRVWALSGRRVCWRHGWTRHRAVHGSHQ